MKLICSFVYGSGGRGLVATPFLWLELATSLRVERGGWDEKTASSFLLSVDLSSFTHSAFGCFLLVSLKKKKEPLLGSWHHLQARPAVSLLV